MKALAVLEPSDVPSGLRVSVTALLQLPLGKPVFSDRVTIRLIILRLPSLELVTSL